jgi:hypothetical protein
MYIIHTSDDYRSTNYVRKITAPQTRLNGAFSPNLCKLIIIWPIQFDVFNDANYLNEVIIAIEKKLITYTYVHT